MKKQNLTKKWQNLENKLDEFIFHSTGNLIEIKKSIETNPDVWAKIFKDANLSLDLCDNTRYQMF